MQKHLVRLLLAGIVVGLPCVTHAQVRTARQRLARTRFDIPRINVSLDSLLRLVSARSQVPIRYDTVLAQQLTFSGNFPNFDGNDVLQWAAKQHNLRVRVGRRQAVVAAPVGLSERLAELAAQRSENGRNVASRTIRLESAPRPNVALQTITPVRRQFSLTGKVVDANTGESLPYAQVLIQGGSRGATTNADGYFSLLQVPTDTVTIHVTYIGYAPGYLRLSPDMPLQDLRIELSSKEVDLDEVVITAAASEPVNVTEKIGMLRMTPAQLKSLPNVGEKDIFRSFQLMPGVSSANENSAGLYVRGGTPDQVLVLFDGFTVYHVDHLYGFFSAFNPVAVKDMALYKGGFEAKYGGRLSSVSDLTGKEGDQKDFNLGLEGSFLSLNGFVEFPIGERFSALVAYRKSWRGPIYEKLSERFGSSGVQMPGGAGGGGAADFLRTEREDQSFFYDLNAKLSFRPTNRDILSLSFYNGEDLIDNSRTMRLDFGGAGMPAGAPDINFSSDIYDVTNWGNTGASLRWGRFWDSRLYTNVLLSTSRYFSIRDRSISVEVDDEDEENTNNFRNGTLEDNNLEDYTLRADVEYKLGATHQIGAGFQLTYNDVKYTYSDTDTTTLIARNDQAVTSSIYLQDKMLLGRLELVPGLRMTQYSRTGEWYTEPRLSAIFNWTDWLKLKAATGRYTQQVKRVVREDLLNGSKDFWVLADADRLPVSTANHYTLGATVQKGKYVLDVEAYAKTLSGLSEYSLRITPAIGETSYDESFAIGTGRTYGLDVMLQRKAGIYTGWLGYTWSRTRYDFPAYGGRYPADHDVTHEFKAVQMVSWKGFDAALTWVYASGRPYTEPAGGYQLTLLDGSTQDQVTVGAKNSQRFIPYHRLDFSLTYRYRGDFNVPQSVSLSLFNLYDRVNIWYKEYQIVNNQVISTDINYLGFTPNFTYTIHLK